MFISFLPHTAIPAFRLERIVYSVMKVLAKLPLLGSSIRKVEWKRDRVR